MIRYAAWLSAVAISAWGANFCPSEPQKDGEIVTHNEFSYINTKGNTDTTSLAFEGAAKTILSKNVFRAHADAYRSTNSGVVSKNKWSTELNYDYQFDEIYSVNYLNGYKKDQFSGFDYQLYSGPGIGAKIIDCSEHKLDVQANMLYAQDKPVALAARNYFSSKLGGIYKWQILSNLKFIEEATYRINLEERGKYFLYSKTGIENKINGNVSMGISYKIDYANTPPHPSFKTDRIFLASLIIDY